MPRRPGRAINKMTGVQSVLKAFKDASKAVRPTVRAGMEEGLELILKRAVELCPKDTTALAQSGRIEYNDRRGLGLQGWVVFGGIVPAGPHAGAVVYYALWVHENLEAFHAPPTKAKFLEQATRENFNAVRDAVGRRVQADIITKFFGPTKIR